MAIKNNQKIYLDISWRALVKIAVFVVGVYFLFLLKNILLILTVAIFLSILSSPPVDFLEKKKIPRTLATFLVFLAFLGVFGGILGAVFPIAKNEITNFGKDFPQILDNFIIFIKDLFPSNSLDLTQISKEASTVLANVFSATFKILGGIVSFILILVLAFYLTVEQKSLEDFLNFFLSKNKTQNILKVYQKVKENVSRWFAGQMFLCFVIFLLTYLVLSFLKIKYAFLLALIAGILEAVPYIGPLLTGILVVLVTFSNSPEKVFWVILAMYLIQQTENHILVPKVMEKFLGLSPVVVILAISIGSTLFGFWGILLAVPFSAAISIILKEIYSS
jgi:predicted PurR-regulated permease PerM